jgi:hypothetical protein
MSPSLLPVMFRGRLAAAATRDRFYLAPHLEPLEEDHPDRFFVSLMCCHARDVLTGAAPGPYSDAAAELAVRIALVDDSDFRLYQQWDDAWLAERYAVPLDQIAHKRHDLQRAERITHGRGRRV